MDNDALRDLQNVQRSLQFYKSPDFQDFKNLILKKRATWYRNRAKHLLGDYSDSGKNELFICLKIAEEFDSIIDIIVGNLEQEESLIRRDFDSPPSP